MRPVKTTLQTRKFIIRNKEKIESKINLEIEIKKDTVFLNGDSLDEIVGEKVIKALNLGFKFNQALRLLEEDQFLKIIDMKQLNLSQSKIDMQISRVIGEKGRSKKMLERTGYVKLSIKNDKIGIIGKFEDVEIMVDAILRLIEGSSHHNIYKHIDKAQLIKETRGMKIDEEV